MQLDCGIQHSRIDTWLESELALPRDGENWVFASGGASCLVSAVPLPSRAIGGIELERTLLTAQGDRAAIDAFQRLFTLRFVSAGG